MRCAQFTFIGTIKILRRERDKKLLMISLNLPLLTILNNIVYFIIKTGRSGSLKPFSKLPICIR